MSLRNSLPSPWAVAVLFLVAVVVACQQAGQEQLRHWTPTPTVLPTATGTEQPQLPTATEPPPTALATATGVPLATVKAGLWNCRDGAGVGSEILLVLGGGQRVEKVMKSADGNWMMVRASKVTCWVTTDALE